MNHLHTGMYTSMHTHTRSHTHAVTHTLWFTVKKLQPKFDPSFSVSYWDHSDGWTYTAEMPASADSKNNCVANSSPATHQTLWQQGGTGEDGHIHLIDWTFSVVTSKKNKKQGPFTHSHTCFFAYWLACSYLSHSLWLTLQGSAFDS